MIILSKIHYITGDHIVETSMLETAVCIVTAISRTDLLSILVQNKVVLGISGEIR